MYNILLVSETNMHICSFPPLFLNMYVLLIPGKGEGGCVCVCVGWGAWTTS